MVVALSTSRCSLGEGGGPGTVYMYELEKCDKPKRELLDIIISWCNVLYNKIKLKLCFTICVCIPANYISMKMS